MEKPIDAAPAGGSGAMFDAIAGRYDLLNRLLSGGTDRRWRRRLVAALDLAPGARVLDLATGTGDVALLAAASPARPFVAGLDPSARMVALARKKASASSGRLAFVRGDAERLPFVEGRFDGVSMAFGIRNVPDRPRALREMRRVLRPGGRLALLELAEPRGSVLGALARLHVHVLVPRIGAWLSGAREYRYLQESIARFPPAEAFAQTIADAGFREVRAEPLAFGACVLFSARA